jgi:DNA-binding GntR family transcriptional regulator
MVDPEVSRIVLADQVKERLLEWILDGTFPPDSRIVETAVAKEMGTSQAPVREALSSLQALGIVEIAPFRGARVRRLAPEELLEAYTVRSAIEVLGARLAMQRLTGADADMLFDIGEQMHQAANAGDRRRVAELDAGFHGRIMELSGNKTLLRVWRGLEPLIRTYLTLIAPGSDPMWSAGLHDPILAAVRTRDVDELVAAIERHFDVVRAWLATTLPYSTTDSDQPDDAAKTAASAPSAASVPAAPSVPAAASGAGVPRSPHLGTQNNGS